MRVVTMASLGGSAVLGIAALIVAKTALPQAGSGANVGTPAAVAQGRTLPVVVASRPIAFGERLDAAHLTIARLPPEAIPQGAFTTINAALAQDHGGAPVALTTIAQRETLLPAKLSGPGARPTIAAEITDGMRAYTIQVTGISGVGGHALPGDRVDVVLMRNLGGDNGQGGPNLVAQVVLQNVRVLGVDLNADPTSSKPATPSNATLEVTVEDAQKLSLAADLGALSLALRRTGAAELTPVNALRPGDFITGRGQPAAGGRPAWRRSAPAAAPQRLITIVEGDGAGSGA